MEVYNSNVFVVRKVFDEAFLEGVIKQHDNDSLRESGVYNGIKGKVNPESRISMQCNIDKHHAITKQVAQLVKRINNEYLNINVSTYCHENHFLKYPETGNFKKHKDVIYSKGVVDHIEEPLRKISAICLLSHTDTFEGGKFAVYEGEKRTSFNFSQGDVVLFPSYIMHQVDPVTSGVRYSTVHWSCGGF